MARSNDEVYDSIIAEKENQPTLTGLTPAPDTSQTFLTDLTSTSKVAIWRLWAWITAVAIVAFENILDDHTAAVEARALEIPPTTGKWYQVESLLFQFGDSLVFNTATKRFNYDPVIEANKVVDVAAVTDLGFQIRIKAAKFDVLGDPIPLTAPELAGFDSYWSQKGAAGTAIVTTSTPADDLKLDYFIKYDADLLASDGSLLTTPTTFPVIDAINTISKTLPFNGVLSLASLTDAVQAATGVLDVTLNSAEAKIDTSVSFTTINKQYTPDAGYLVLDEGVSTFTYNTQNV